MNLARLLLYLALAAVCVAGASATARALTPCPGVSDPWGGDGVSHARATVQSPFFVDCNADVVELVTQDVFVSGWYRELQYKVLADCVNTFAHTDFPTPPGAQCDPPCPNGRPCFPGTRDRFFVTGILWGPYPPRASGEQVGGCLVRLVEIGPGLCKVEASCRMTCSAEVERQQVCGCPHALFDHSFDSNCLDQGICPVEDFIIELDERIDLFGNDTHRSVNELSKSKSPY